jgi:uncharacterized membrane protein
MTRFDDFEENEEYNFRFGEPAQDGGREHHMVTHRLVCVCPPCAVAAGIETIGPATADALRAMCEQKQTGKNNEA